MAEENWIKINENTQLLKGDIVKLHFALMSVFDWDLFLAVQMAAIEARIEKDPRFFLMSITHPENGVITFKVRVDQNPVLVGVLIALIAVPIAFGIGALLTCTGMERLARTTAAGAKAITTVVKETGWTALKIGTAVLIGTVGFIWLKKT